MNRIDAVNSVNPEKSILTHLYFMCLEMEREEQAIEDVASICFSLSECKRFEEDAQYCLEALGRMALNASEINHENLLYIRDLIKQEEAKKETA